MPRTKKPTTATKYYKILNPDMTPCHGGSGKYSAPSGKRPGKWMPAAAVDPCRSGYHACEVSDLSRWLKADVVVWECEMSEDVVRHQGIKSVASSVRLIRRVGVLDRNALIRFAHDAADHVLRVFESRFPSDNRPRLAIEAATSAQGAAAAAAAAARAAYAAASHYAADAAADADADAAEREWQGDTLLAILAKKDGNEQI